MPKREGIITIDNFNQGGLAYSKWSGIKHSLYKLIGWDLHSTVGLLKVAQKLAKDTSTTITALCRERVSSSNGISYWFSYTDGKIWQNKAGTWTLVYTTSPAAGTAGCFGAIEFQGFIYWATQSRLHRIAVGSADGAAAWTANAAPNWATFTITDAAFHPMIEQNLILFIGDGNYVAQVDAGVFTANALDIKTPLRIKSLGKIGTDILLGTFIAATVNKAIIFRWDTWSVSFTGIDEVDEVGINAFLPSDNDNLVFVQAGIVGNIYRYDGEKLEFYIKIPGDYSPTAYGEVYPSSVSSLNGKILFGFSNGSGNPAEQGVYQLGRSTGKHNYILDLPYPISERSGSSLVMSGIEIGGILAVGVDLYVSWKNGTTYGIDKLDYSNKMEAGYLETRLIVIEREKFSIFPKFVVAYASLPASTAITIQYSKNYTAYADTTEVTDTARLIVQSQESVEATTLQIKVLPTVSGNSAPEIESMGLFPI